MLMVSRLVFAAIALLRAMLVLSPAFAQDGSFQHPGVAKDAERYETFLRANFKPGARQAGDRSLGADPRAASSSYALSVAAGPRPRAARPC